MRYAVNQDFLLQWEYADDVPYISDNPWLIVWINNAPHDRYARGNRLYNSTLLSHPPSYFEKLNCAEVIVWTN
jgi:hypothetical protein